MSIGPQSGPLGEPRDGSASGSGCVKIEGSRIVLGDNARLPSMSGFVTGILRKECAATLTALIYGDGLLSKEERFLLHQRSPDDYVNGCTQEWAIQLDPTWRISSIVITPQDASTGEATSVKLIEPVYLALSEPQ